MGKEETLQPGLTLGALLDSLLAVLFAPRCAACGLSLERPSGGAVCRPCWDTVPPEAVHYAVDGASLCQAAGEYAGSLSAIIHALKYQHRTSLAGPLAALIARRCGDVLSDADVAVPVPLHASRLRERGFNQAALLAGELPLPCRDALVRIRATASQTDLPAPDRRRNVKGAFAVARNASGLIRNRRVVLVDDVATTGATLGECARVLREAGAADVRAVTAARAL